MLALMKQKKVICLNKFLEDLEIVPNVGQSLTLYYDNSIAVAKSKEPRSNK